MRAGVAVVIALAGCGRIGFEEGSCPPGYAFTGGSCYRFVAAELPWIEAEAACEADGIGAHLAVIDSAAEAELAAALAGNDHWIGASDLVAEGVYLRVIGGPILYATWDPGQPEGPGENCIYLSLDPDLHDHQCGDTDDYLCEYDGIAADPAAFTPP